jgi:ATP citrate (pro-S)-lyase
MEALRSVGVQVGETFVAFVDLFSSLSKQVESISGARSWKQRSAVTRGTLFSAPKYKHADKNHSFTEAILMRILQRESVSHETVVFADTVFSELIDHGPHVSGAVNTIITTRAGKDMPSALATGILTIGDRFGGAINNAAFVWHEAVSRDTSPLELVQDYSKKREYIPGIGHKKYNIHKPDPRVASLIKTGLDTLTNPKHLHFAEAVARETSKKKENLILNVDGTIAALFLDYLEEKEQFHVEQVKELLEIGFFNSLFVIPRTIGFVGHYLDQKRIDEGLFRFGDKDIFEY